MADARTSAGQRGRDKGPGIKMSATAGFDNGKSGCVCGAAFLCAGAEAETAGDDGDSEGSFGLIIRSGQTGIGNECDDCRPVIEDFPSQRPYLLGLVVPVQQTGPFQASLDRVEDGVTLILGHGVDQTPQFPNQPFTEANAVRRQAPRKGQPFADEVGHAPLPFFVVPIGPIAIADQPADDGVTEEVADFLMPAAADVEDGGGRGQHHPEPAEGATLVPGRLVGMDQTGTPDLFQQLLGNRLAGDTDFPNTTVDRADRERDAHPGQQELLDFPSRLVMAQMQGGDEGGETGADHTILGQEQLPRAPLQERKNAGPGTGFGFVAAGAGHHLITLFDAGDPDAAVGALQLQHRKGRACSHLTVPQLQWLPAATTECRPDALGAFRLQRLVAPLPLGPRLLAGLSSGRSGRLLDGSRRRGGSTCTGTTRAASSERWVRGRWPRAVGRVHRQTLGHIRRHGMKAASQLDELVVLKRLEYCAVQVREVWRHLRIHAQSESELSPLFKPKIPGKSAQSHFAAPQNPGSERVPCPCVTPPKAG